MHYEGNAVRTTSYARTVHDGVGDVVFEESLERIGLRATSEVPKRLMHPKRRTVGLRVPDNAVAQALLADLGEPLMSVTLIMPGDELPLIDPYEIRELLERQVDLVIDGGYCGMEATTVVDMADEVPMVLRAGKGDPTPFEAP